MTEQKTYEADIPMKSIFADAAFNCRGDDITPGSVMDLAEDIKQNPGGLLQRIILRPWVHERRPEIKFQVVAGNRRFTACRVLKWETIPAKVIEGLSDDDAEVINLSENLKRRDLNILQEAKAIDKMLARGVPPRIIAKRLDVYEAWVTTRIQLLKLPEDVQTEAALGIIKQSHIPQLIELYRINPDQMYEGVRNIKNRSVERKKIKIKIDHAKEATPKREYRNMSDVFKIQELMLDAIGTNLGSLALAWVIGEIDLTTLLSEVKREADLLQMPWSIPDEYK